MRYSVLPYSEHNRFCEHVGVNLAKLLNFLKEIIAIGRICNILLPVAKLMFLFSVFSLYNLSKMLQALCLKQIDLPNNRIILSRR